MTATILYKGDLRTEATHTKSNNRIVTDAPTDNHGKGEAFSPTDLVCSALASCMLTIMGISANTHHINMTNTQANVTKVMADNPRRIGKIRIDFIFENKQLTDKEKQILRNSAIHCPVMKSLSADVEKEITFDW